GDLNPDGTPKSQKRKSQNITLPKNSPCHQGCKPKACLGYGCANDAPPLTATFLEGPSLYESAKAGYGRWFNELFGEYVGCAEGSASDCGWSIAGFIPFAKIGGWATKAVKKAFRKADEAVDSPASSAANGERLKEKLREEAGPIGSIQSVDEIFENPSVLRGATPEKILAVLKGTPGWRVENLRHGSRAGQGWVFRYYDPYTGNQTPRMIRWHPGGGHHGPDPYWRVVDTHGDVGGIIQ
ncbi:hypothetical protein ACWEPC_21720, partial [Nonomuraea sp. NPDC004297]